MARDPNETEITSFVFDAPCASVVRGPHCLLLQIGGLCFEISGPECDECGEEIDWTLAFATAFRRAGSESEVSGVSAKSAN